MSGYPTQIAEAETKLRHTEAKLEEIEALKVMEPKLRREAAALTIKIAELKENIESEAFHGEEVEEAAPVVEKTQPAKIRDADGDRKALMRTINKKLKQIEGLKGKEDLDADAKAKVAGEAKLRKHLACLEAGETFVDSDKEDAAEPAPAANFQPAKEESDHEDQTVKLPADPEERKKRVKTLQKKLQQITKLKEKGGDLDKEAKEKIAGEDRINEEIAAIEAGKDEVTFIEKTADDVKNDLEKKARALEKKLASIAKIKNDENLDADAKAKVANEGALKKELGHLTFQIGELNKKERERVAARLGWEAEQKKKGGKK